MGPGNGRRGKSSSVEGLKRVSDGGVVEMKGREYDVTTVIG